MQTNDFYILIKTQTPSIAMIKADCAQKHMQATNSKMLPSQRTSLNGQEVLIKVRDGDQAWVNSKPWKGEVQTFMNNGKVTDDAIRIAWALADDQLFEPPTQGTGSTSTIT